VHPQGAGWHVGAFDPAPSAGKGDQIMPTTKKGFSLHLGLNAVDPARYAGWRGELAACEADADDMLVIAKEERFQSSVLLKTPEVTRDRVKAEIEKAAAGLAAGDLFFLTYSGHGWQVPDRNGDEDDFTDETWCLYDGQLIDDELYAMWQRFAPGVRIMVLSDSCHSGTMLRLAPGVAAAASARGPDAPKVRAMPVDAVVRTYQQNKKFYDDIQASLPGEKGQVQASVRLISGCQDNQLSSDGAFNGLFTATLLRVWKGGGFKGNYRQFHSAIVQRMPPDQTPNHFFVGQPSAEYDAQRPFSI
jgi:hypothetical protein